MANLVSVPYQPGYKDTPGTVALLMKACSIAGHDITLTDAWRSYAEQAYYWDQYVNHGGNVASNPDTGQRNHMRGAAVDIQNRADRQAMLQAGFTPDSDEWWHFNDPNWQNMPIIPVDDSTAPLVNTSTNSNSEETEMYYRATSASDDGAIGNGWLYKQIGDGPVVAVTNLEDVAVSASGAFVAGYNGNDIRLLSAIHGLAEYEVLPKGNTIWNGKELLGPGKFTGKLIFSNLNDREYPTTQQPK